MTDELKRLRLISDQARKLAADLTDNERGILPRTEDHDLAARARELEISIWLFWDERGRDMLIPRVRKMIETSDRMISEMDGMRKILSTGI